MNSMATKAERLENTLRHIARHVLELRDMLDEMGHIDKLEDGYCTCYFCGAEITDGAFVPEQHDPLCSYRVGKLTEDNLATLLIYNVKHEAKHGNDE